MNKLIKKNMCDLEIEFINNWAVIRQADANISLGSYPNKRWDIIIEALDSAIKGAENKSNTKEAKMLTKLKILLKQLLDTSLKCKCGHTAFEHYYETENKVTYCKRDNCNCSQFVCSNKDEGEMPYELVGNFAKEKKA